MTYLTTRYRQLIDNMGVPGLEIPLTAVRFYRGDEKLPDALIKYITDDITLTSCQALKQASLGDPICLTRSNIGCIAAAISFGLVDENDDSPFEGPRVYTEIMKNQAADKDNFTPPTPKEFTEGVVYACNNANRPDFALFGEDDSGRFSTPETARLAIDEMLAIQPADTNAVFCFPHDFDGLDITPDIIVMSVRPVELTRLIQAYQYNTGKRIIASMGSVRVVNSDLIVRPYLKQEINVSPYCVGARLIGQYEGNRLGIGFPWKDFETTVTGMKDSRTGYPFHLYPDADNT